MELSKHQQRVFDMIVTSHEDLYAGYVAARIGSGAETSMRAGFYQATLERIMRRPLMDLVLQNAVEKWALGEMQRWRQAHITNAFFKDQGLMN